MTTDANPLHPTTIAVPDSRPKHVRWLNVLLVGALALALGGVSFAIGRVTAPATAVDGIRTFPGTGDAVGPLGSFEPGAAGAPAARPNALIGGAPTIDGTVTAIDADSMTITLASGDTLTVALDDGTAYHTAVDATADDVAIGDDVSIRLIGGRIPGSDTDGGTAPSPAADDVTVNR